MLAKKLTIVILFSFLTQVVFTQRQWAWMNGDKSANADRVYGTLGVAAASNTPGARIGAASWLDKQGQLWLFGGKANAENGASGLLNDLWMYNPANGQWAWMGGTKHFDEEGHYEVKSVPSADNIPGARQNGISWTDNNGEFWLFGGLGMSSADDGDENTEPGMLNDLWKYSPATGQWTFVSGTDQKNENGRYGFRLVGSPLNYPGGRYSASGWLDNVGNLWLFGGRGYSALNQVTLLDDVWKYSPSNNSWTFMNGDATGNADVSYGQKQEFSNSNTPGGRHGCTSWVDKDGNFWLMGGGTLTDLLSDLWKYDPDENQWSWFNGSNLPNQPPSVSQPGVPNAADHPGARTLSATWVDDAGDTWMFGGNGYGGQYGSNALNDLWKYSTATNQWAFLKGDLSTNPTAVYGTKGIAAEVNTPGGTANAALWKDQQETFWMFGGRSGNDYVNQVWKLSVSCATSINGSISPASAVICEGGSQVLSVTGGTSYEWRRNGVVIPGQTNSSLTATQAGTYSATIYTDDGCSAAAANTSTVAIGSSPQGTISPATGSLCATGTQVLTATGGTSYEWKKNGETINGETGAVIVVNSPGVYSVIIKNGDCTGPAANTAEITTGGTANGARYADISVNENVPVRLSARNTGIAFQWTPPTGLDNPSSGTPLATLKSDQLYLVSITLSQGCSVTDTQFVKVNAPNNNNNNKNVIRVPNAFTPNGNNVNDRLRPLGDIGRINYFKVYNRWGNLLFQTNTVGHGWDGKYGGVAQPTETYTWVLSAGLRDGKPVIMEGKTVLIR